MDTQEQVCDTPEVPVRTWGKYPDIQKNFPYSDQVIEALIAKYKQNLTRK